MQLYPHTITLTASALLLVTSLAMAQDKDATAAPSAAPASPPGATTQCAPQPGAPAWMPCGPDRTLTEDEVRTLLLKEKEGLAVKMTGTSGTSGKDFFLNLYPGGKVDSGQVGGRNWGKSWKFEGGKLCRDYYAPGKHCGVFEVSAGNLYLFDDGDAKKSRISSVEHVKP